MYVNVLNLEGVNGMAQLKILLENKKGFIKLYKKKVCYHNQVGFLLKIKETTYSFPTLTNHTITRCAHAYVAYSFS